MVMAADFGLRREESGKTTGMTLANCTLCNRLFNRTLHEVCTDCREAEEAAYSQLCEFLARHLDATMSEAAKATGVEPELIRRLVRSGRLVGFDALAMSVLTCQRCGAPVPMGRFCASCQRELREGFSPAR